MKKILIIMICSIYASTTHAQQAALYDQYHLNPYLYNPAYAGKTYGNVFLLHKKQWTSIEGSPTYNAFTIDGSVNENVGLGLHVLNETKGITSKIDAQLTYAYHLKFSDEQILGFGVSAGLVSQKIDFAKTILKTPGDPALLTRAQNKSTFNSTLGIAYQASDLYLDISVPQLLGNSIEYTDEGKTAISRLARQLVASAKYQFRLEEQHIDITPQLMANYSAGAPLQYDANVIANWNNVFWAGISYKSEYAIAAMAGFKLNELKLGYAYEMPVNSIKSFAGTGHEIALAYTFYTKKDKRGKLPTAKVKRIEQKLIQLNKDLKLQENALKRKEKDVIRMIDRYYVRIRKGMKAESPESLKQRKAIEDVIAAQNSIQQKISKLNKQIEIKNSQLENQ